MLTNLIGAIMINLDARYKNYWLDQAREEQREDMKRKSEMSDVLSLFPNVTITSGTGVQFPAPGTFTIPPGTFKSALKPLRRPKNSKKIKP